MVLHGKHDFFAQPQKTKASKASGRGGDADAIIEEESASSDSLLSERHGGVSIDSDGNVVERDAAAHWHTLLLHNFATIYINI